MREMRLFTALSFISLLSACNRHPDLDGTYIAEGQNYALMLQMKSDNDHDITGTIITAEINEGMKVQSVNKPISGTVEGKAVNFNVIHPAGNSPATTPVSSMATETGLELTFFANGNATPIVFRRGSAEEYHHVVEAVFQKVAEFD